MKKSKHTTEQIIRKLRDADSQLTTGAAVRDVYKHLGISEATYYRWKREYVGMQVDQLRRLKELEKENARLKRLVAEQALETRCSRRSLRETSEPGPEASCGGAPPDAVRDFPAPGVPSGGPAEIDAASAAAAQRG